MPTYRVTAPDGKTYDVTGNGTAEEALAHIQQQAQVQPQEQPQVAPPAPVPQNKPNSWAERMFPELAQPTARLDPLAAQNQGNADAGAALINLGADSTVNLPGQLLGFGAKVLGQLGRNVDPSIDPAAWRQAVTQRTTIPTTQRGQEVMAEAVAPATAAWERNVTPTLERYPALGAAAETAGTALEGAGWALGIRGATRAAKGAMAEAAARPKVSYPQQAGVGTVLKDAPSIEELKTLKTKAYEAADKTGVVISRGAMNRLKVELVSQMKKEGLDPDLHPKAVAVMRRITNQKGQPTLSEMETLRKVAKDAADSLDKAESRLGSKIIEKIDDFEDNLSEADVISGNASAATAFKEARALNSRYAKAKAIEKLFSDAEVNAGPNFNVAGYVTALRNQFKALAKDERKLRGFTAEEREAIRKVAVGGTTEQIMYNLGKFAPQGVISGYAAMGAAMVNPFLAAIPIAGGAGRYAATKMAKNNANAVSAMVRRGPQNFVEKAKGPSNE